MKCDICGKVMKTARGSYKYIESGLDNVYLTNVVIHRCSCGESFPEISNVYGLHRAIAQGLVGKQTQLTGPEIRFLRKEMRVSAKDFARSLSVTSVTVSRWETDTEKPKMSMDKLIRLMYVQFFQEHCKQVVNVTDKLTTIKEKDGNKPLRIDVLKEFPVCHA